MLRYVFKRLTTSIGLLVLSSMLIFLVLRVIPGDPTITKLGGTIKDVDPRAIQAIRHQLGLDQSLPAQYVHWVGGVFHGNFGAVVLQPVPGHDARRAAGRRDARARGARAR